MPALARGDRGGARDAGGPASAKRRWRPCPTRTGWRCRRRRCRPSPPAGSSCTAATTARAWGRGARPSRSRPARRSAQATTPRPRSASRPSIGWRGGGASRACSIWAAAAGVLAIAAARVLPGARVLAVDNDPLATAIARANARLNGVGRRVRVLDAAGFAHPLLRPARRLRSGARQPPAGPADRARAGHAPRAAPGGVAVLSGLLDHQAREVGATLPRRRLPLAGSQPPRRLDRADDDA